MTTRRSLVLAGLACAALLAGCGSSGSGSSSTGSTAAPATTTATSGTHTSPAASPAQIAEAVAECKQIIQSQSKLPASAKTKLEGACGQAAKGNTAAVKAAAREVCEEVIGKAGGLSGSARETALQACKK